MSNIKVIRDRLGLTQAALAEGIGCTQGNVGHYEKGQTVPPDAAKRLIAFAAKLGCTVSYEDIYGRVKVKRPATDQAAEHGTGNGGSDRRSGKDRRQGPRRDADRPSNEREGRRHKGSR